jgi:hypothetical protein
MDGKPKKISDTSTAQNSRLQPILPQFDFVPRFDVLLDMGKPLQKKLTQSPVSNTKQIVKVSPQVLQTPKVVQTPQVVYNSPQVVYNSPKVVYNSPQVVYNSPKVVQQKVVAKERNQKEGLVVVTQNNIIEKEGPIPPHIMNMRFQEKVVTETPLPPSILPQETLSISNSSGSQAGFNPLPQGNEYSDRTIKSVNYATDVKKHYINIDTRYRPNIASSSTSNFRWALSRPIKNAISIRVASIEIPNNFYAFSQQKQNISFFVKLSSSPNYTELKISEGNYLPAEIGDEMINQLITIDPNFIANVNLVTGKFYIENAVNAFDIQFPCIKNAPTNWGLGYNLGFTYTEYTNQQFLKSERIVDLVGDTYIFLQIGDYEGIQHEKPNRNILSATAKIVVTVEKFAILFDNGSNFISKEVQFPSPANISSFDVRLFDTNSNFIDLLGTNYSFTVEIVEILNARLYSNYSDHLLQNNDTVR